MLYLLSRGELNRHFLDVGHNSIPPVEHYFYFITKLSYCYAPLSFWAPTNAAKDDR